MSLLVIKKQKMKEDNDNEDLAIDTLRNIYAIAEYWI